MTSGRIACGLVAALLAAPATAAAQDTYTNPVTIAIPGSEDRVETFADPAVIKARDGFYYAYGTSDPLNARDRDAAGALRIRRIPMARSSDLVR